MTSELDIDFYATFFSAVESDNRTAHAVTATDFPQSGDSIRCGASKPRLDPNASNKQMTGWLKSLRKLSSMAVKIGKSTTGAVEGFAELGDTRRGTPPAARR